MPHAHSGTDVKRRPDAHRQHSPLPDHQSLEAWACWMLPPCGGLAAWATGQMT